jgi:hypothetical protein
MGGDPAPCAAMQTDLAPLFVGGGDIDRACDAYSIRALVAKDNDPVFENRWAWPWTRATLVETEHVRAVRCGSK